MNILAGYLGNKKCLAEKIVPYFPAHDLYIELFFGAGGMFFNKPKAKYNICNDIDDEIYNLFMVLQDANKKEQLLEYMMLVPYHETLRKHWMKHYETEPIKKAGRLLFLNNYLNKVLIDMSFNISNSKKILLERIANIYIILSDVKFMNTDFKEVFKKISFRSLEEKSRAFIYADPPYLNTINYKNKWTKKDTEDLFEKLVSSRIRFAMSEYNNAEILELAKYYNLNVNIIAEKQFKKNTRTEILITNYKNENEKRNDLF